MAVRVPTASEQLASCRQCAAEESTLGTSDRSRVKIAEVSCLELAREKATHEQTLQAAPAACSSIRLPGHLLEHRIGPARCFGGYAQIGRTRASLPGLQGNHDCLAVCLNSGEAGLAVTGLFLNATACSTYLERARTLLASRAASTSQESTNVCKRSKLWQSVPMPHREP